MVVTESWAKGCLNMHEQVSPSSEGFIESLCAEFEKHNRIDPSYYEKWDVKRGLRNADGTGVMAGVTQIGNVLGYYVQDGERIPADGRLIYRGIDVVDLVNGFVSERRSASALRRPPTSSSSAPCPPGTSWTGSASSSPSTTTCPVCSPRT